MARTVKSFALGELNESEWETFSLKSGEDGAFEQKLERSGVYLDNLFAEVMEVAGEAEVVEGFVVE